MGDLSRHFNRKKFACECGCGFDTADYELIDVLEKMRMFFNHTYGSAKVKITGGNRCFKHNEKVQKYYNKKYKAGSSKSTHMTAKAVDFKVFYKIESIWKQIPSINVNNYLESRYPGKYGIGLYDNRTHLDVRKSKARWNSSSH